MTIRLQTEFIAHRIRKYVSLGSDICLVINDDRHDDDDDDDDDGNDDNGFLMAEPNGLIPTTVELNYLDIRY